MNNFFPSSEYKMPSTNNYMKFVEGPNPFRVLSHAIVGYEYFTFENKPVRQKENFDSIPSDIKKDGSINHFWAFAVWNYNEQRIQVLELTQKTVMNPMQAYIKNPKWGDPKKYDFVVNRKGSGMETDYSVITEPHSDLDVNILDKAKKMKLNLEAMFVGEDPFAKGEDKLSDGSDYPTF